jgi:hypothetical protein
MKRTWSQLIALVELVEAVEAVVLSVQMGYAAAVVQIARLECALMADVLWRHALMG